MALEWLIPTAISAIGAGVGSSLTPDFADLEAKTKKLIEKKFRAARNAQAGLAGATAREGAADLAIQARQGGFAGSPIESALSARIAQEANRRKAQELSNLYAQESATELGILPQIQAQKQAAQAQMLNQIFQSLGSAAGNIYGATRGNKTKYARSYDDGAEISVPQYEGVN